MNKRERLEKTIAGESTDHIPVTFFRHWQGDDQRAADLARALFSFQSDFDWDFVIATASNNYAVTGYGLQDTWDGSLYGLRTTTKHVVKRSLDWTELRTLEPTRGDTGKQLECLRLLGNAFDANQTPYIQVVYSPLSQAARLGGLPVLLRDMRVQPDRLRTGLNIITETTLRFIEALRRTHISGICYIIDLADYASLSEVEYQQFGMPYDLKILEYMPDRWWLNMVHLSGSAPMLPLVKDYPVTIFNWNTQERTPSIERAQSILTSRVICGGLSTEEHLHYGSPAIVRDASRKAIDEAGARRFILSASGPLAVTTPRSNIQAARDTVS